MRLILLIIGCIVGLAALIGFMWAIAKTSNQYEDERYVALEEKPKLLRLFLKNWMLWTVWLIIPAFLFCLIMLGIIL